LLEFSEVFEEVATKIAKIAVVETPLSFDAPRQEEPPRIFARILYFQNIESLAYISVADSVYLHSNLCSVLQKTHLFCNRVRYHV